MVLLQAARCAYAIIVMALYWMTEAVPMAVTALLPIVFMPWFGIMDSRDVCQHYLQVRRSLFHFNWCTFLLSRYLPWHAVLRKATPRLPGCWLISEVLFCNSNNDL